MGGNYGSKPTDCDGQVQALVVVAFVSGGCEPPILLIMSHRADVYEPPKFTEHIYLRQWLANFFLQPYSFHSRFCNRVR